MGGQDKDDKNKNETVKDWVNTDKDTDDLVADSFAAGDADKDWNENPSK